MPKSFSRRFRQAFVCSLLLTGGLLVTFRAEARSGLPKRNGDTDTLLVSQGRVLFQNNCSACHNFRQKGIGPGLGQVRSLASAAWIRSFIKNPEAVIRSGDTRATQLFYEYKNLMPSFGHLKENELDALVAYIEASQVKPSGKRQGPEGLPDPIPTKIAMSGLVLDLETVLTAPPTAAKPPLARITKSDVLPGRKDRQIRDRLFMVELRGKLYDITDNTWEVALDLTKERPGFIPVPGLATGFGSFAFHPEFYENGLLYTTHTEKARSAPADYAYADSIRITLQWVLTEWKISDPTAKAFTGSSRELMRINMVSNIHGVQEVAFNPLAKKGQPDYGLLYIGIGDGGASENGYPFLCGSRQFPWGSVWRIDPRGTNSKNGRYGIPATNPFASDSDPRTVREIYCRGFRNPNRLTWTPDGRLLIADIGHTRIEELNLAVPGGDYGWPYREGTFVINPAGRMDQVYGLPADDKKIPYRYPVAQYDHDEGRAISGGFVYEGKTVPALRGKYLFGDITNGRIFYVEASQLQAGKQAPIHELALRIDGKETNFTAVHGLEKPDFRLGKGFDGEILLMTKADGKVYRIKGATMRGAEAAKK